MTDDAAAKWEDDLIADMRAHDGAVTSGPLAGHPLLISLDGLKTASRVGRSYAEDGRLRRGRRRLCPTNPSCCPRRANPDVGSRPKVDLRAKHRRRRADQRPLWEGMSP